MKSYLKYSILLSLFLGAWSLHANTITDLKKALRYSLGRFPKQDQAERILKALNDEVRGRDTLTQDLRELNNYFGLGMRPKNYENDDQVADAAYETLYRIHALFIDDLQWIRADSALVKTLRDRLGVFMARCYDRELAEFHSRLEGRERIHLRDFVRLNDTLLLLRNNAQRSSLLDIAAVHLSGAFHAIYAHFFYERDNLLNALFRDDWIDGRVIKRMKLLEDLLEEALAAGEGLLGEETQATPPAAAAAAAVVEAPVAAPVIVPVVAPVVAPIATPVARRPTAALLDWNF